MGPRHILSEIIPVLDCAAKKGEFPVVSTELRRVLGMKAGMGMTGSSDNGIVDWSLLDVSGYGAMVELREVQESSFPASVLKRWSA